MAPRRQPAAQRRRARLPPCHHARLTSAQARARDCLDHTLSGVLGFAEYLLMRLRRVRATARTIGFDLRRREHWPPRQPVRGAFHCLSTYGGGLASDLASVLRIQALEAAQSKMSARLGHRRSLFGRSPTPTPDSRIGIYLEDCRSKSARRSPMNGADPCHSLGTLRPHEAP